MRGWMFWMLGALSMVACTDATAPGTDTVGGTDTVEAPQPMLTVTSVIGFTREGESGTAPGFDLDGVTSLPGEEASCGHGDFLGAEGAEGIDNQLALITPLFDTVGIGAVEGFVQAAVEQGGLLIMWELQEVEDPMDDDSVVVVLRFGTGKPLLGTDGLLLSGQTFAPNDSIPARQVAAKIVDGWVETEAFDAVLPILMFEVTYELELYGARIRAQLTDDGGLSEGVLGGSVPVANILEIAARADEESGGVYDAVAYLLDGMADMSPDAGGKCQELSAALSFTAVSAFVF